MYALDRNGNAILHFDRVRLSNGVSGVVLEVFTYGGLRILTDNNNILVTLGSDTLKI